MKCGYCGKAIKSNQNFCTGCGRSVSDISEKKENKNQSKGSSFMAVLMLIVLIIVVTAGGAGLIMNSIKGWYVSDSQIVTSNSSDIPDDSSVVSSREPFVGDKALSGEWKCDDKSAAGYGDSDYSIETSITLTFDDEGNFSMNYRMMTLGITARNETLVGSYSAKDGSFNLKPDLSQYKGDYFQNHSSEPTVKYSVEGDKLVITSDSGKELIFTKA